MRDFRESLTYLPDTSSYQRRFDKIKKYAILLTLEGGLFEERLTAITVVTKARETRKTKD